MKKPKIVMLLVVFLLMMISQSVLAAEKETVTFNVNQSIKTALGGTAPNKEVKYRLSPINSNNPMPNDKKTYDFSITGDGSHEIKLDFTNAKESIEYNYTIERLTGDTDDLKFAEEFFNVRVYSGIGEEPILIIYDENFEKVDQLSFSGAYNTVATPVVSKTAMATQTGDEFQILILAAFLVSSVLLTYIAAVMRENREKQNDTENHSHCS